MSSVSYCFVRKLKMIEGIKDACAIGLLLFFFFLSYAPFRFCSSYNCQSRNFDVVTKWGATTVFLPFKELEMLLSLLFLISYSFVQRKKDTVVWILGNRDYPNLNFRVIIFLGEFRVGFFITRITRITRTPKPTCSYQGSSNVVTKEVLAGERRLWHLGQTLEQWC